VSRRDSRSRRHLVQSVQGEEEEEERQEEKKQKGRIKAVKISMLLLLWYCARAAVTDQVAVAENIVGVHGLLDPERETERERGRERRGGGERERD
jgi:hypothetical protein